MQKIVNGGRAKFGALSIAFLMVATSCDDAGDETRDAALSKQLIELKTEVDGLRRDVETLRQESATTDAMKRLEEVAYLTPGAEGYSLVTTDLGRMTVSLADVQPYANGSRVKLNFGNLTSATITGAKATLEWGSVDEKGMPQTASTRSREIRFTESLRAGAWTYVPVVLEGVPPSELGFVRIKEVGHTGILLLK